MNLHEHIMYEKKRLEEKQSALKQQILTLPPGSLFCQRSGSRFKYFQQVYHTDSPVHREKIYLKKSESETLRQLVKKALLQKQLKETQVELDAIYAYLRINKEPNHKRLDKLISSEGFRNLILSLRPEPETPSEDAIAWQLGPYNKKTDHPEGLVVPSVGKEMVRSKSEAFIAFSLFYHNIPYRYECKLQLKYVSFYPDFTIRHPDTGQEIIWEHFGMMDDPDYVRKTAKKLKAYIEAGYIPNKTLFMTFEAADHPLDLQDVTDIIEHLILSDRAMGIEETTLL